MAEQADAWKQPRTCERPGCPVVFTPYRRDHKYCSPRCKKTCVAYKYALQGRLRDDRHARDA